MTSSAQQDESAVAAVRLGDAERYRDTRRTSRAARVCRRVYAVAWSRLGDAALAEEVTQEAFIRAYRRLWLLGDGAKFAGWVNTIARHMAINLGLRHRRELNKRQALGAGNPENSTAEKQPTKPTRSARRRRCGKRWRNWPAAHRECLVLFYLEGRSGAEAAAALGISEAAMRVRLHRARAAMRERLEKNSKARWPNCVRPGRSSPPSWLLCWRHHPRRQQRAAWVRTILGGLAKFAPFKWLFTFVPLLLPLIMMLPVMILPAAMFFSRLADGR